MTFHIHICGQVQGVGFRPLVYRFAKEMNLSGWVSNGNDGVHIQINAEKEKASVFYDKILTNSPILSRITSHSLKEIPEMLFESFEIRESDNNALPNLLLTPDAGLCEECRKEILDKNNRRYAYAFTTCTNCGVRYSIMETLPYDRANTSMKSFTQCTDCQEEYGNPLDRRHYSQTNSCENCGVKMRLYRSEFGQNACILEAVEGSLPILKKITKAWAEGKIVAIKGIGGYLLTCDATNALAISTLRQRKHRPTKPFALMYPDVASIEKDTALTEIHQKYLQGIEYPIVLLDTKENIVSGIVKEAIAPKLNQIGVMLPYTPLFALLLHEFKKPIIATSGNLSNSPIVFEDQKAVEELGKIADFVLTNDRQILVPQDDSVISLNRYDSEPIIVRRSRGYAPTFIQKELAMSENTVLAMGAMMKNTFALSHQKNVYLSQYLGDLESFETQENYKLVLNHFLKLFKTKPEKIIIDKHPNYFSTQFGKELAENEGIEIKEVQHHLAHFGAVLGENNLINSLADEKILGIIWDGTGLGDDGNIWGGEFFSYQNYQFVRLLHFDYFPFILGNKMPKEPRISALCAFQNVESAKELICQKFTKTEWQTYQVLLEKHAIKTSSVGRLFDAIASLVGLSDRASYEGEAAMLLENAAYSYYKKASDLKKNGLENLSLSLQEILQEIAQDVQRKCDLGAIALKFHYLLVNQIKNIAKSLNINKIAFSGGVFQNNLLVTLIKQNLGREFELFFHKQLSPNDENIAFGQLVINSFNIKL